jgi:hypothetical protein
MSMNNRRDSSCGESDTCSPSPLPPEIESDRNRLAQLVGELLANHWLREQSDSAGDMPRPKNTAKDAGRPSSANTHGQPSNSRDS